MIMIPTPAIHIDLDIVNENIRRMVSENKKYGIAHRPHIKTHKSLYLAQRQLELGAQGITCAKLGEAEVMADGGIRDILIAFPLVGDDKLQRYKELCLRGITIRTIINSVEGAVELSRLGEALGEKCQVLVEVDGGIHRGGVPLGEPALDFARQVRPLSGIEIVGLLYYGGDIYGCKTLEDIQARSSRERDDICGTANLLKKNGFTMDIVSGGSSFSAKHPSRLQGITETRAGNYIFNDCAQLGIGMVKPDQCALRVTATIVSRPGANTAIVDAGSKTLTTDLSSNHEGYGYVVESPDIRIVKLNEEHGFLESASPISFPVGDRISIIPNHACVIPNLADEMYGMRGGKLERMIKVDARGKNR